MSIVERTRDQQTIDAHRVADLAAVRAAGPLVHAVTNYIAAPLTANVLLALGAAPAMVSAPDEVAPFAAVAGGVVLNLGGLLTDQPHVFTRTAAAAAAAGTPWVLDPVAVGAGLRYRDRVAADLVELAPTVIRGNASEIVATAGGQGGAKGVESTLGSADALPHARDLARRTGGVVAVSGAVDYVTDGDEVVAVPGGHVLMTKVTGVGCSLGAVIAAFAGVVDDPLRATVSASAVFAHAGARAGATGRGTGTFAVAFLDELSTLGT